MIKASRHHRWARRDRSFGLAEPTNWRAGCGRSASPVRRAGGALTGSPSPITNGAAVGFWQELAAELRSALIYFELSTISGWRGASVTRRSGCSSSFSRRNSHRAARSSPNWAESCSRACLVSLTIGSSHIVRSPVPAACKLPAVRNPMICIDAQRYDESRHLLCAYNSR